MVQFSVVIGVSWVLAFLIGMCGMPGGRSSSAVLGGVLAGLILGPAVLGRAWPRAQELLFVGGVEAREAIADLERERGAAASALSATGVTGTALDELEARYERQITAARAKEAREKRLVQRASLWCAAVLLGIALAGVCASVRLGRDVPAQVLTGVLAFGFGGLTTAVILRMLWRLDPVSALLLGCGAGVMGIGGWRMRGGMIGGLTACVLAGGIVAALGPADVGAAFSLAAVGACVGAIVSRVRAGPGWIAWAYRIVVPALVATGVARVDPMPLVQDWRGPVFVLVSVLLAGGGQVVGTWLGMATLGRDCVAARSLNVLVGTGAAFGCAAGMLSVSGAIDVRNTSGSAVVLALVLSGLVIEVVSPGACRMVVGLDRDLSGSFGE